MKLDGIAAILALPWMVACQTPRVTAEQLGTVKSDLAEVQEQIKAAQAEDAKYSGGLVKSLIVSRIAILQQTEAMVLQKLVALKGGIEVQYAVDGRAFVPPTSAKQMLTDVESEIIASEAKIKAQEAEVARFSGGLTQAVSLATLETLRQTHAMLEQKKVSLKYGLPQYIGFANTDNKAASGAAVSTAKIAVMEGSTRQNASDEMRKTIKVTVVEKGFLPADPNSRRYQALLAFKCSYENASGRDIRAFTGTIVFQDLFEKQILRLGITISEPIKAGQLATWSGTVNYNQFMDAHQRLRATELQDMRIGWEPASIIFADGSRIGETSQP